MRQGDPLSPFLFLIVAESLNVFISEAIRHDVFQGIKIGRNEVQLSHLQYADDTIIFGQWNMVNAKNLIRIMRCHQEVSGLKINLSKSKVFGIGFTSQEVDWIANGMGCVLGKLPTTYLVVPIGLNMRNKENWKISIEKFRSKLADWKARLISFGGGLTLVRTVLGSMALYYFSLIRAPMSVIESLESVRKSFFWGGMGGDNRNSWVKWEKILRVGG